MDLDVIIPVYNPFRGFRESLESVCCQSYRGSYGIIVVDDGSSVDLTPERQWVERKHPKVKWIRLEKNRGVAFARNRGIEAGGGELIAFHDADDQMAPDRLEQTVEAFGSDPALVFVCANKHWVVDGVLASTPFYSQPPDLFLPTLLFDHPIASTTVSIKRSILETTGLFNESYPVAEDYDLWARILTHFPNQIKYVHSVWNFYHRWSDVLSLSQRYHGTLRQKQIRAEICQKYRLL